MQILVLILALFIFPSFAFSETKTGYYVYLKAGSVGIDDPDADTDNEVAVIPGFRVTYDTQSSRGQRFFAGFEYLDVEFQGGVGTVNQEVSGYSIYSGYEKRFVISRSFKPWVGAALNFNSHTFENRFTVDEDGFLDNLFSNREENYIGISLYADHYFNLSNTMRLSVGPFADLSFSDGVQTFGFRIQLGKE